MGTGMNQREAVIYTMKENGGYATLGHLYENALKVDGVKWKTKTPFASIRRIVQNPKFFFKIQPGLWALNSYKNNLPFSEQIRDDASESTKDKFSHSYYQGLLVEIGNMKELGTFVPAQDKNKLFLDRKLNELTSLKTISAFGFPEIVNTAKTIDVSWFNRRAMPHTFIEVEHTTSMTNSFTKFVELQDFNTEFWIAASKQRLRDFESKSSKNAFEQVRERVKFVTYDQISALHANLVQRKFEIGL